MKASWRIVLGYSMTALAGLAVGMLAACSTDAVPESKPSPTVAPTAQAAVPESRPSPTVAPTAQAAVPKIAPSPTVAPTAQVVEAPQGEVAPDFTLPTGSGGTLSLDGLVSGRDAAVVVFYRGLF